MFFAGFQKLTLLDYPGKVACILFTNGCNFRCPFCHNASLVRAQDGADISDDEVLEFLKKRQGILEGVCISGGEPLIHNELKDFIREVKKLGYPVKLDTNGSFPQKLRELIGEGLVDYVAMDIKNSFEKYNETTGISTDIDSIKESIEILINGNIDYEFRTTLVSGFHTPKDMQSIGEMIKGTKKYYLQNFADSGDILCPGLAPLGKDEMELMKKTAEKYVSVTQIRGI
ncbi:MAG: anaerobic ribonucleoside-triphosphate reductase activating protein [Clostridia bacterium]|nr:anaerobic ribonucleoside-triphosphate reductase activating protein [Clostridia bacterium]